MPGILRFEVGGRELGLLATDVREVLRAAKVSPLPEAPVLVIGVLVVRGETLPIYDIRARFGIPNQRMLATDAIVVARAGDRFAGIVVDRARDLVEVEDISASLPGAELTSGIAVLPDGALVICDLATFLSSDEQLSLARALEAHG